jgi:hypothetical protein
VPTKIDAYSAATSASRTGYDIGVRRERRRIRKAIAPALRSLREFVDGRPEKLSRALEALRTIDAATRAPRRQAKRRAGKGA